MPTEQEISELLDLYESLVAEGRNDDADFVLSEAERAQRSFEMGGPFLPREEQELLDAEALRRAREQQEKTELSYPSFLPAPPSKVTQAEEEIQAREAVSSPGGDEEEPYSEAIRGFVPMLRPTRIVEKFVAPLAEPVRLYTDPDTGKLRPPTATEELIESFARQPVLTESAGRALAAGARPEEVQKRVGPLEGAVIETPFQAATRALPSAVLAPITEAYRDVRIAGEEPLPMTAAGLGKMVLETLASDVEPSSTTLANYIRKAGEIGPAVERKLIEGAVGGARAATGVLERIAGQEPGSTPLAKELATLGVPQPVIPAPKAISDKPVSQRIREGETVATLIAEDPKSAQVYDREFGVLAPIAPQIASFVAEAPLPFTPLGVLTKGAKAAGVTSAVSKAVQSELTSRALQKAESTLANKLWGDLVGGVPDKPLKTFKEAEKEIRDFWSDPLLPREKNPLKDLDSLVQQAEKDLARVAPRTDLVRVSPSYAVPKDLAPKVIQKAAEDVALLRKQAQAGGRALTRAEEAVARDTAVRLGFEQEARRLDELGQFQVLLDGLDTPRVWDTGLFRAVKAFRSPESAMKRAAVVAAEEEVARKGQNALRQIRKEIEAGTKAGRSLDDMLEEISKRELAGVPKDELLKKVLEEAYGGPVANSIFERVKEIPRLRGADIRPDRMRELHAELVKSKIVDPGLVSPNFAANSLKIIMEEGVRKRVSKEALETFKKAYPDLARPTLALPNKVGPMKADALLEERQFFENGAEEFFRFADQIPARAVVRGPLDFQINEALGLVSAEVRNARQKFRLPLAAEAQLLGGELVAAPVRAFLTTGYKLPVLAEKVGVNTPYGYLQPADLDRMINDLGGFGPSRMDVKRRGLMVQDILLSAAKGFDLSRAAKAAPPGTFQTGFAKETAKEALRAARNLEASRPWAYAAVDAIEESFRRGVFAKALQEGRTPEAAMTLARRSQLDYGAPESRILQSLAPYWASAVSGMAAGAEFVELMAKNPQAYTIYLRALRAQQGGKDPEGIQGDLPLTQFFAPIPEGVTKDVFGRPLDILGPEAPGLQPLDTFLGVAKTVQAGGDVIRLLAEGDLIDATLQGSVEASDELLSSIADLSSVTLGEGERKGTKTFKRTGAGATTDQTYLAVLAVGKALGMEGPALRFLEPKAIKPPPNLAAFGKESYAWATKPPDAPGTFIYKGEQNGQEVFFLAQPSKEGRQRIKLLESLPFTDVALRGTRAAGAALEEGLPDAALWYIGAETVEEPTRKAVEQTR